MAGSLTPAAGAHRSERRFGRSAQLVSGCSALDRRLQQTAAPHGAAYQAQAGEQSKKLGGTHADWRWWLKVHCLVATAVNLRRACLVVDAAAYPNAQSVYII